MWGEAAKIESLDAKHGQTSESAIMRNEKGQSFAREDITRLVYVEYITDVQDTVVARWAGLEAGRVNDPRCSHPSWTRVRNAWF